MDAEHFTPICAAPNRPVHAVQVTPRQRNSRGFQIQLVLGIDTCGPRIRCPRPPDWR